MHERYDARSKFTADEGILAFPALVSVICQVLVFLVILNK